MLIKDGHITTYNEAEKRLVEMPLDKWVDLVPPDAKFTRAEFMMKLLDNHSALWDYGFSYTISEDGTQIKKSKILHDKIKKDDSRQH